MPAVDIAQNFEPRYVCTAIFIIYFSNWTISPRLGIYILVEIVYELIGHERCDRYDEMKIVIIWLLTFFWRLRKSTT